MVIGSGTSFKGSDINTDHIEIYGKVETSIHSKIIYVGTAAEIIGPITCDHIEIHGSVSGGIQVNGKVIIKKSESAISSWLSVAKNPFSFFIEEIETFFNKFLSISFVLSLYLFN